MSGRFSASQREDGSDSPDDPGESPVLVVDGDHRCVEANETASRLLGLSRAQLVGMHLDSLHLPQAHLIVLPSLDAVPGAATRPRRPERMPSARELEVLGLLAGGATDAEIAEGLGLSAATVQTHVRNAKTKLGARTRAQAVALALVAGLIDA